MEEIRKNIIRSIRAVNKYIPKSYLENLETRILFSFLHPLDRIFYDRIIFKFNYKKHENNRN